MQTYNECAELARICARKRIWHAKKRLVACHGKWRSNISKRQQSSIMAS